jgi:hypothetical protein
LNPKEIRKISPAAALTRFDLRPSLNYLKVKITAKTGGHEVGGAGIRAARERSRQV